MSHGISKSKQYPPWQQDQLDLFCKQIRNLQAYSLFINKYSFGQLFEYASVVTGPGSLPTTTDQTAV